MASRKSLALLAMCLGTMVLLSLISDALPVDQPEDDAAPPAASWCVAQRKASLARLQVALDWACGPGQADCSAISPGQSCYLPNNARPHASYAFNSYYLKNGKAPGTCNFSYLATVVYKDPSKLYFYTEMSYASSRADSSALTGYGSCIYPSHL